MDQEVRVTTQAEVFDDHFESHQFLSPGGTLFEVIASNCLPDGHDGTSDGFGKIWLLTDELTHSLRLLVRRKGLLVVCDRLSELIEAIQDESSAGPFDPTVLRP